MAHSLQNLCFPAYHHDQLLFSLAMLLYVKLYKWFFVCCIFLSFVRLLYQWTPFELRWILPLLSRKWPLRTPRMKSRHSFSAFVWFKQPLYGKGRITFWELSLVKVCLEPSNVYHVVDYLKFLVDVKVLSSFFLSCPVTNLHLWINIFSIIN